VELQGFNFLEFSTGIYQMLQKKQHQEKNRGVENVYGKSRMSERKYENLRQKGKKEH
jgi:hypothetical protein